MTHAVKTIAITGGTGYIGAEVVRSALARNHRVRLLGRRPSSDASFPFAFFDLHSDAELDGLLDGCKAVIHLAADTGAGSHADPEVELKATRRLIRSAADSGARLVYVSSLSASPDSPSGYARAKWLVEREVERAGGCIVRAGMVYGGREGGLFGELCRLVRRLPVLPAFVPPPNVQPIHVNEIAAALIDAAEKAWTGTLSLADATPMSLTQFLRVIARERVRAHRLFVPVPIALIFALHRAIRWIPHAPDISRLRSLYATPIAATAGDLKAAQRSLQAVALGMHRGSAGRRRALLNEARTMLIYVLRARPGSRLMRRHVRAVEALDRGRPLLLPSWLHAIPFLLSLADAASAGFPALQVRIAWATRIAEASGPGAVRFLSPSHARSPLIPIGRMALAAFAGLFFRVLARIFAEPLRRSMRSAEDTR